MKVYALVGSSGTGKSYQAMNLAQEKDIDFVLDDGLMIHENKVIGGRSAKRENSRMAAVKRALFLDLKHRGEIQSILHQKKPKSLLIIGTSERMVEMIAENLELGGIDQKVFIEQISSPEDIRRAKSHRAHEGMHIIPVPTFQIKEDFSGYFLNPLRVFRRFGKGDRVSEKSVVRPTFSYLGDYRISNRVIRDLVLYASFKIIGVGKVWNIEVENTPNGLVIGFTINIVFGNPIRAIAERVQEQVREEIEYMTSFNIVEIKVFVKNLIIPEE